MELFDDLIRLGTDPKSESEPAFVFLNRSARQGMDHVRSLLESWFSKYPEEHRADLRGRFRDRSEYNHESAFYELFLFALLRTIGCDVEIHPACVSGPRRPDFLVKPSTEPPFYLEATVVMQDSESRMRGAARFGQLIDALNTLESPDFYLDVDARGFPEEALPLRDIKQRVSVWLETLDHGKVSRAFASSASKLKTLPAHSYRHGNWTVEFRALPKGEKNRGKAGVRTVGMRSTGGYSPNTVQRIRRTLLDKAGAYGKFEDDYVIAVNTLETGVDEEDIVDALFGSQNVVVTLAPDGSVVDTRDDRARDGLWTSPEGQRNTRVNAVLMTDVRPWWLPKARFKLYESPWVRLSPTPLSIFPRVVPVKERLEFREGEALGRAFDLSDDWPTGSVAN